jgi:superfamily II DNA or RNA helicase
VRSLGGKASLSSKQTHFTYKGEKKPGKPSFVVHISYPRPNELFTLSRKRERLAETNQYSEFFKLRVIKIEPIGEDLAQCISVAHPEQLYVTNDFVVTHNTYCALAACAKLSLRIGIVIKSMYIDKWIEDLMKTYEIRGKEIMVIKGASQLKSLTMLGAEGGLKHVKAVIVSITTVQNWISEYEELGDMTLDDGYACRPWEFFETIGVGTKLVDEVHQHFHQMFKLDLYTHVKQSISLSATLLSQDAFLERMYEVMFPRRTRPASLALNKYIDSYAVHYTFKAPEKLRTTEFGSKNYSHTALEKSILKHVPTKLNYFRLIDEAMRIGYFNHPRKKKKLAVYAASIEMCSQLTEYFSKKYPHLDIRRYCDDDDYNNVIEADIRFSTIGSSGTAIDIPDLTTVILTVALSSIQANIQVLGRLREIKDSNVEFYFFTADDIDKHAQYYTAKREMLNERARSFRDVYSGLQV